MSTLVNNIERPIFFLDEQDTYTGNAPYFFNNDDYQWVSILEDNYQVILDEFKEYISGERELESTSINPPYLSEKDAWQNVYFWNFLWKKHKNCKRFPKTYALLKSVPNLTFAEVTALKPNTSILPHIGETNVTIRGHLGLRIPGKFPDLGIQVGNEKRAWEEGKVVLFSDAHRHAVWNHTNEKRFVLVFDVLKDEYANKKYWMNALSLGALTVKFFDEHIHFFKKLPNFLLHGVHLFFSILWFLYLPVQNKIRFLP
ncbi:MAG: aspartyl/asparaginyl beta-hydroxylase domain-containing protein [Chitinophagales bacterium]